MTKKILAKNFIYFIKISLVKKKHLSEQDMNQCLNTISKIPELFSKQALKCGQCLTEKELFETLKRMSNDKSPWNDGFTKEFFKKL